MFFLSSSSFPEGGTGFEEFLLVFLWGVAELWATIGAKFDAANQGLLVLRRNNRYLIGSLKNAKQIIGFTIVYQLEKGESSGWSEAEPFVNQTLFSVIAHEFAFKG